MTYVDRTVWHDFAERFTRAHDGWGATLEARFPAEPLRVVVDDYPFRGMTVERRDEHDTLILTFGDDAEEHFGQIVEAPRELSVDQSDDGDAATVMVRASDGGTFVLLLSNPLQEH